MPKLGGSFYSETSGGIGIGSTAQDVTQRLQWFAIYLDDGNVLLRAMDGEGLPSDVTKIVSTKDFFSQYSPDKKHYTHVMMPLLSSLREKLLPAHEDALKTLDKGERKVFKALQLNAELIPGLSPEKRKALLFSLLEQLPDYSSIATEHLRQINNESISSRKNGRYEESLTLYNAMLRTNPGDNHIFFNIARVYFEKGDYLSCRKYLLLALDNESDFKEARKFLDYLDKHQLVHGPDVRQFLRYQFNEPQPCVLKLRDKHLSGKVLDISEAGAQFQAQDSKLPLFDKGVDFVVKGESHLLAPLLIGNAAQVVWMGRDCFGAAFARSLDAKSLSFRRIVAYARVV